MLFVIGLLLFLASLCIGIGWGDPHIYRYNRWDRVAQVGVALGSGLMTLSICIFLWGLLP